MILAPKDETPFLVYVHYTLGINNLVRWNLTMDCVYSPAAKRAAAGMICWAYQESIQL